jgi:hypothetical protein
MFRVAAHRQLDTLPSDGLPSKIAKAHGLVALA